MTRRPPRARRRSRRPRRLALLLAAVLGVAWSQPYAADGGFDRPRTLASNLERPLFALGLDHGRPTLVTWTDGALIATPLAGDAPAAVLGPAASVRSLAAHGGVDAPLLVVWVQRDLTTGRYAYRSTLDGDLLSDGQRLPLVPLSAATGATVLSHRGHDGGAVLERLDGTGTTATLYASERSLAGLSASVLDGVVHLTWLEGRTEVTPLGAVADWRARAARLEPDGRLNGPVDLGPADGAVVRTLTVAGSGGVVRAWTGTDGVVRRWWLGATAGWHTEPDEALALVPGRPVGAVPPTAADGADADLFVARADAIWRVRADGAAVPVVWSPVTIQDAAAVRAADGHLFVAWSGTEVGGRGVVYASDDRRPLVRGWRDEAAARFGWRPWSLAEEAAGQLAGSLLLALLAAAATLPGLWLLAALLAGRGDPARARWRGGWTGAALPALAVGAAWLLGWPAAPLASWVGGWPTLGAATASAALLGPAAWRRADLEPMPAFVAAGVTAFAWATAVVAFVGFPSLLALGWW